MKLRDVLKDESCWTKGVSMRDKEGNYPSNANDAVCFCIVGAVAKVYGVGWQFSHAVTKLHRAMLELYPNFGNHSIVSFNDDPSTTFEDVCKVIEKAGV